MCVCVGGEEVWGWWGARLASVLQVGTGGKKKAISPDPGCAPAAECERDPENTATSSPFQYSLFSKSNTCDIKIKLLLPGFELRLPLIRSIGARQHLNTDRGRRGGGFSAVRE